LDIRINNYHTNIRDAYYVLEKWLHNNSIPKISIFEEKLSKKNNSKVCTDYNYRRDRYGRCDVIYEKKKPIIWTRHFGYPYSKDWQKCLPKTFLMIPSIPPHFDKIKIITKNFKKVKPVVVIPEDYKRFKNYSLHYINYGERYFDIHKTKIDNGPYSRYDISGFFLNKKIEREVCLFGDDDMYYPEKSLLGISAKVLENPDKVFTGMSDKLINGVMGFSVVAGMCKLFSHNFTFVNKKVPEECFFADDIVISYYLHKHNVSVLKHGFINTFKHSKWQHDKTSVNSFHRNNNFSINRKCLRVLEETNKL